MANEGEITIKWLAVRLSLDENNIFLLKRRILKSNLFVNAKDWEVIGKLLNDRKQCGSQLVVVNGQIFPENIKKNKLKRWSKATWFPTAFLEKSIMGLLYQFWSQSMLLLSVMTIRK